jgi:hypothetical protein
MKKILLLLVLLFSLKIYAQEDLYVSQVLSSVNSDSLMKYVKELSGVNEVYINGANYTISSRHKNYPTNNVAANYLKQKLESYGLVVYDQNFSTTGRNVYAVQPGIVYPEQKYIICAHYDDMPNNNIAPGADDNASGCAAVIEAARILSNYNTLYTVVYVFFDEEEQGLVGSNYFATQARNNNEQILGVLNADMIAWDNNNDGKINIHTKSVANSVTIANDMKSFNTNYSIGLNSQIYNPGSSASDHSPFWNKNYGAILLIEDYYGSDFNSYYHTVNDKIDYFNVPYFTKCSKLIIGLLSQYVKINSVIPVQLVSFNAVTENSSVKLQWVTATETNNRGFEIQKSLDGIDWQFLSFITGNGTSSEYSRYSYTDINPTLGNNFYRLVQYDYDGTNLIYGPIMVNFSSVYSYKLEQNYPNPFNPVTNIKYSIPIDGFVNLKVYDVLGNEVAELVNEFKTAGSYEAIFNVYNLNKNISSGIYFYRLTVNETNYNKVMYSSTKQMVLVK